MAKKKKKTIEDLKQEFEVKRQEQARLRKEQKQLEAEIKAMEDEEERNAFEEIGRLYFNKRKRDNDALTYTSLLTSMKQSTSDKNEVHQ